MMNRLRVTAPFAHVGMTLLIATAGFLTGGSAGAVAPSQDQKVIVLGFDGADATLTRQFLDEGILPNLARLRDAGTFAPLGTANPAQSPVSWACLNTGQNPGKTNIFGFIRRGLVSPSFEPVRDPQTGRLLNGDELAEAYGVMPEIGWSRTRPVPTETMISGGLSLVWMLVAGLVAAIAGILLMRHLLRAGWRTAVVVGLLIGFGAGLGSWRATGRSLGSLPPEVPMATLSLQARNFWDVLDDAGVKSEVIQAAMTFPVKAGSHTKILSGLGVPDVAGGYGAWYIYTNDPWQIDSSTGSGGRVVKFRVNAKTDRFQTKLFGPDNFAERQRWQAELDELQAKVDDLANSSAADSPNDALAQAKQALQRKNDAYRTWSANQAQATAEMSGTVDTDNHELTITIDGQTQTLRQGEWSDFYRVDFAIAPGLDAHATVRFFVQQCDAEKVSLFAPALSHDPLDPAPYAPIASPPEFAAELAGDIGEYDTIGWSCQTNAVKDELLEDQAFLDDIGFTVSWRRNLLRKRLARGDFDCYFQVFGTVDRVCHMMWRHFDPQHPLYDEAVANEEVTMLGRRFKKKDAIREIYREMDSIVGEVEEKIRFGEFGDDVVLMVVSDHGFQPFREQFELNRWLLEQGYLVVKGQKAGQDPFDNPSFRARDIESYADWTKTRAYSLGLGKVFINLAGRERHRATDDLGRAVKEADGSDKWLDGIVAAAEYDALCDEIGLRLRQATNPRETPSGRQPILATYRRSEIYTGDYWREKIGKDGVVEQTGCADILVGFAAGYRVAWATGTGGMDREVISENRLNWSGGHASTDPSVVHGIFFANRPHRAADGSVSPGPLTGRSISLMDVAPTVIAAFGVDVPASIDGKVVPLQD